MPFSGATIAAEAARCRWNHTNSKSGVRVAAVRPKAGEFLMALLRNDWPSHELLRKGVWEINDPAGLTALAGQPPPMPGGLFIDIGANIGWYSFLFAQHGYSVLAVEPLAQNRGAIQATMCMNPRFSERITLVPIALGPPSECVVRAHWNNRGNGELVCFPEGERANCSAKRARSRWPWNYPVCEVVASTPLDDVVQRLVLPRLTGHNLAKRPPVIVKIDVEGAECSIFAGGQSLFARVRPEFIQVEGRDRATRQCIADEARRHGYQLGEHLGHDNNTVIWDSRALA